MNKYKLTLGPCLFNWKVNDWRDFYCKIADESPFDEVYLGEVVCYKRWPFFEVAFNDVVNRLEKAGKKVHFSSFSLILGDLEMRTNKKMIDDATANNLIEVNDVGLLGLFQNKKYIVGPTVNVYNEGAMQTLIEQGAVGFCFPFEIDKESLQILSKISGAEKEVFAFGRMPLAIAARCYHARIHNTSKDDCRYVCEKDYNGKPITTLSNENFLTVNGTQTMSFSYNNLIHDLHDLQEMGVNIFRLSPHYLDMISVANLFKDVLDKKMPSQEAYMKMEALMPADSTFSNGFYHGKEGRIMDKLGNTPVE